MTTILCSMTEVLWFTAYLHPLSVVVLDLGKALVPLVVPVTRGRRSCRSRRTRCSGTRAGSATHHRNNTDTRRQRIDAQTQQIDAELGTNVDQHGLVTMVSGGKLGGFRRHGRQDAGSGCGRLELLPRSRIRGEDPNSAVELGMEIEVDSVGTSRTHGNGQRRGVR